MLNEAAHEVQAYVPYFDPSTFDVEDPENSLRKLLQALTHYEDAVDNVDWSMMNKLVEKGALKIDAFVHVKDHLEGRIAYLTRKEKEWQAARKSAEAGLKTLLGKILWAFDSNGVTEFPGVDYRAYIKYSNFCSIEEENVSCTKLHRLHYEEFVRVKYEWDKESLTDALNLPADHPLRAKALKVASIKQNKKVEFEVIREREEKKKGKAK